MQPKLFPELETEIIDEETRSDVGKRIVRELLSVRRRLETKKEREFIHLINYAIKDIRSKVSHSEAERERLILHSIEMSQASSFDEISEDTRISTEVVREVVYRLESQGVLEIVSRGKNPMSKRIFSKRTNTEKPRQPTNSHKSATREYLCGY